MIAPLRQLFTRRKSRVAAEVPPAAIPSGQRVYVIGDIHGRLDLFEELIAAVERDDLNGADADTTIILLGDLVDRGPDSAGVIERARDWQAQRRVRILAGNHEEMFLNAFDDLEVLRAFLKHGGRATIFSYGIKKNSYNDSTLGQLQDLIARQVPQRDRDFLSSFEESVVIGDYLFVHAGIVPDVSLEDQKRSDKLWIREPFLRHEAAHSHMVVHGHTMMEDIQEKPNRIGIDTGAYRFGRLTALALEGDSKRYIQAVETDGTFSVEHRAAI